MQLLQDSSITGQSLKRKQGEEGSLKVNHVQPSVNLQILRHSSLEEAVSKWSITPVEQRKKNRLFLMA